MILFFKHCTSRLQLGLTALLLIMSSSLANSLESTQCQKNGDGSYTLDIQFSDVQRESVSVGVLQWDLLSLDDCGVIGQPGAPDLPSWQQMIEMPDASDIQVEVLSFVSETIEDVHIYPCQERLHTEDELPLAWLEEEAIYSSSTSFPGRWFDLDEPALLRNHRVCKLSIYPVQVEANDGRATVLKSIRLRLSFDGVNTINQKTFELAQPSPIFDRMLAGRILNPDHADEGQMNLWHDAGALPGNYLVVTRSGALSSSAFQNLLEWKRQRGHHVEIVTEDDMASFTTTNIRSAISAAYTGSYPPDFVMLIGDVAGTYGLPTHGNQYDHFYAMIEGGDILGDVAVGRLAVDNATQLATVCNKIVMYEKTPYAADDAWLNRAGLTVGSSVCGMSMKILSRSIAAELVTRRNYNDIDTAFCAGSSHVVTWFEEGLSFYNYRGWIGMEGLSKTTVLGLSQGPRTPVATIFTCSTGDFDYEDDYTEAFLNAGSPSTPGGAVACMGFATSATHTRYNNVICGGYYGGLLEHETPWVGSCLLQGKYELWLTLPPSEQGNAANFAYWGNLMGDPGTSQWAGSPATMDITLSDDPGSNLRLGANAFQIHVNDENGIPKAGISVCVYQADVFQRVALTDDNGDVLLSLEGILEGSLKLTLTHDRYTPVFRTFHVQESGLDPALESASLDGMLRPGGVPVPFDITIRNDGSETLSDLDVAFSMNEDLGSVNLADLTLPNLAPGESTALEGIEVTAVPTLADGDDLPLQMTLSCDQGTFTLYAMAPVRAPMLSPGSVTYPGGTLEPGSTREISLRLHNLGTLTADNIMVDLISSNPFYLEIPTGTLEVGDADPSGQVTLEFEASIHVEAIPGQSLPVAIIWSEAGGSVGVSEIQLTIGDPSTSDPTGPDSYGYWAYEDDDDTYELAPAFDWVGITSAEGGQGTEMALYDNSEDDDAGAWLSLPFTFQYYGETYDEMMVCTNGFVAFDEDGFGEWDFRNHYLPTSQGPDAMIAPMWDDHMNPSSANNRGIWYWYDEANARYIITWDNLSANQSGGPNTFQLILLDPSVYTTITGDGPFIFQYEDFNDTQSNYTDFDRCSVGLKDHTGIRGMTLLNYSQRPGTMHTITDGTAIYFTTTISGSMAPAELTLSDEEIVLSLESGETGEASMTLYNEGEMPLFYSLSAINTVPTRDGGGPDDFGYIWMDSDAMGGPVFDWIDISESGLGVGFTHHDSLSVTISSGFTMHLYGVAFDTFRISPNGAIIFSSDEVSPDNLELPNEDAPRYMIAPWWDNLNPSWGDVRYWTNNSDSLVVSWNNVQHHNAFSNGGPISAQLLVKAGGEILMQIQSIGGDAFPYAESGSCGVQGDTEQGFGFIYNEDVHNQLPWSVRLTPPSWMEIVSQTAGTVAMGDSTVVDMFFTTVPGYYMDLGDVNGLLRIISNDLDSPITEVPVTMTITGTDIEDSLLPTSTQLHQAWPNPFNPSTRLRFDLAQPGLVTLSVYNLLGQEVSRLVDGNLQAGSHTLRWSADSFASGIYIVRLSTNGHTEEQRLLLLR